jgi:hypothetical protein
MHRGMTYKCPGAAAKHWDDKASSICETKSAYSCEQCLLYALFLVLYLLFWMSVHDSAACNFDLRTAGWHTSILWDVCCHHIKKKALLPVTWVQFMPFSFVLYALNHYYIILYLLFHESKTVFGCVLIAGNHPIGTSTTGDQSAYKQRAAWTHSSISNVPSPMIAGASTGPSG